MLHKKNYFQQLQPKYKRKTYENQKKTTKIGLAYVQFYKTKLHRGRKRR